MSSNFFLFEQIRFFSVKITLVLSIFNRILSFYEITYTWSHIELKSLWIVGEI